MEPMTDVVRMVVIIERSSTVIINASIGPQMFQFEM